MNLSRYSNVLMVKKLSAQRRVIAWYSLNLPKFPIFSDAQAITTVIDEVMRTAVLNVPIGILSRPRGHAPAGAPTRRRM
jgi:hypothetical protein